MHVMYVAVHVQNALTGSHPALHWMRILMMVKLVSYPVQ